MLKFYAGIGSRQTPPDMLQSMSKIAALMAEKGYVLRSGGAQGADLAFEQGAGLAKRIYLPWIGFAPEGIPCGDDPLLQEIAKRYHPAWDKLSRGGRALMTRNAAQISGFGSEGGIRSEFVVCWTPLGKGGGGTGQAIRHALDLGIPVFDLALGKRPLWDFMKGLA